MSPGSPKSKAKPAAPEEGAPPARILIVDDEEDFHDLLRQTLEPLGYEIVSALDGAEGLAAMRRERPDLMILDINMPVKDGWAVCREVRADPEFAALPILMLTIRSRDPEIIRGLDHGADDYLTKPFEPGLLRRRIQALLERA